MMRVLHVGLAFLLATPVTALAAEAMPPHNVAVPDKPFTRTLRPITLDKMAEIGKANGIYHGSPKVLENRKWYDDNFYNTLAAKKIWKDGTSPAGHVRNGPITWSYAPIPQYAPPPCDQAQPTGYDAEGCRIVNSLFRDVEATMPEKVNEWREQIRRGRDVWYKGTFGNQDLNELHLVRTIGDYMHYEEWLHTKQRKHRFTKWGMVNDPDCTEGDASTFWTDKCQDPHSSGVLGYRKYFKDATADYNPHTAPYEEGEMQNNKRWAIGHPCVQCHVGIDPTNPPKNPNEPAWENLTGHIGNQHINQPLRAFLSGVPENHFAKQATMGARPGTVDTSLNPNDFMHNPGTQNNITDFMNKRVFTHKMKHPITGEIKEATTFHVLKGGEDSVGDHLALIRVYINIGLCTEECWTPNFPVPGTFFGPEAVQKPMRIKQCYQDCEAWNYADAKMPDLAAYLLAGGPYYLMNATDIDGSPGSSFIDKKVVPQGRKIFARECARCHSTKVPPDTIANDKSALEKFYEGHVFGKEDYWQYEFAAQERESAPFRAKFLVENPETGAVRPKQFAQKGMLGQDWLGNDERRPFQEIGTNMCRAMHDNHNVGHIWEEYASLTFQEWPSPGSVPKKINRMFPLIGGMEFGEPKVIEGGSGYLRNISLLSVWAHAPMLHNNAIGELTYLPDGQTIDYTVRGRVKQFEIAMQELLMSDDPAVSPHRTPKTAVTTMDFKLAPREDGQGFIKLPVDKGTPVAYFTSSDPHSPLFQKCDDLVENKGHQFGVDLSEGEKHALTEFLKMM